MSAVSLEGILASLESGARPPGGVSADSGEVPSLGGEHLNADGGFDFSSMKRIPRDFFESMRGGKIAARDILVVKDGATTGKTSFVGRDFPFSEAAVNEHVFCLRVDPSKASPEYVFHFLRSRMGQKAIALDFRGATVGGISREFAKKVRLLLPPLPEQRRIAEVLDKVDALRAKRRTALAQLDTLTQSIFLDMFGDPATNPMGWSITKLGEVISVGPQNGLYRPASDYGTGTPILRIDAFYDGVVTDLAALKRVRISNDEIVLYGLKPGDIVVNRVNSREYLGKSALIPELPEPTVFESNMMRFGVDTHRLNPVYLIHFLQTRHVRAHILRASKDAVNQSSINQQDVKNIPITLPPPQRQERFARYVDSSQKLANELRVSAAHLNAFLASLQYRAFAGEL
jgi:type I restriction enzyme S subunit